MNYSLEQYILNHIKNDFNNGDKDILIDMLFNLLDLDSNEINIIMNGLEYSKKSLIAFLRQSLLVYAKTINGKYHEFNDDLSSVLTYDLLNLDKYKTHPKRIEVLTIRAISAIQIYNDVCLKPENRWFISASIINELTGSRVTSINKICKEYKQIIDEHNSKYGLHSYTNRDNHKNKDIKDYVNLVGLVPRG